MKKKIDLIIPCYNTHKTLPRLFGSIMSQTIADEIHIIMVDDCSDEPYDKFIKPFQKFLDIEIVRLDKNSGPGAARRVGMAAGKSKYIMFIDSDDTFANSFACDNLLQKIIEEKCDVVYSDFIEETNEYEYHNHQNDGIWVFGKIYRREFLENLNITFNDTRSNEDTGFNALIRCFTKPSYLQMSTYVWHLNPKSITRQNNALYTFSCIQGALYNKSWAFKEARKKGWKEEYLKQEITSQFISLYFDYIKWYKCTREEIDTEKYLDWVKRFYEDFKEEINSKINEDDFESLYRNCFVSYYNNFDNIYEQNITFKQFIEMMDNRELTPYPPEEEIHIL